jgi:hypothetical protein
MAAEAEAAREARAKVNSSFSLHWFYSEVIFDLD